MAIKVGTEDKKKVYLASGLGAVMLILLVRFLWQNFGPSPAPPPAPAPVVTVARPAPTTAVEPGEGTAAPAFGHQAAKVGGLASLDLRRIRRSCVRLSHSSTPAMGEISFPSFLLPRRYPNRSRPYARRRSIPDPLRLLRRPPSTWVSTAMRRSGPARDRCFCCMGTTSSSRPRGMSSTGVIA